MPLNKKYSKPLTEELTKDIYPITRRDIVTANAYLTPRRIMLLERPYHTRGWEPILLVRWDKLCH
jgi:hypothetical protein